MSTIDQLTCWVKLKHEGQFIKRSGKPYFIHLLTVAKLAANASNIGYETGLCHDTLEDTNTTAIELLNALISFGYNNLDASHITGCVVELTDVFTANAYPNIKKAIRKKKEAERLATISPTAQTVKYADLIDNISWMLQYDIKKAETYLQKKKLLVLSMAKGDVALRQKALDTIRNGLAVLQHN